MKLTSRLAQSQIKCNRGRTIWTLLGIALSTAMITAVCGFVVSADAAIVALRGESYLSRSESFATLLGMGAVLCLIIASASVIVVSNAFRFSAGERAAQFGILKSVGATRKQIASTVMYECLFLSAIGIPSGVVIGLLVELAGTSVADYFLIGLNQFSNEQIHFRFIFVWQAVLIAMAGAFVTVSISAWMPARKAAKVAAIDAIKQTGEVKLSAKKVRTSRIIERLFGFEGTLAAKSLKRGKRNFRSTVVSLTISIILFLTASGFGSQIGRMANLVYPTIDAQAVASFYSSYQVTYGYGEEILESKYSALDSSLVSEITQKLTEYGGVEIFAAGGDRFTYTANLPTEMVTAEMRRILLGAEDPLFDLSKVSYTVELIAVDKEHYAELCRRAGVPVGSNILVNNARYSIEGKQAEFAPYHFNGQTLLLQAEDGGETLELPLHGELKLTDVPNEVMYVGMAMLLVIVPEVDAAEQFWFTHTADAPGFSAYAEKVLNDTITQDFPTGVTLEAVDIAAAQAAIRAAYTLIMVFIYGFVGMLTLIGLTNVISTIATNVRSRSREFAVLKSVGMTQGGLRRMLNLESLLCSAKALLYGLPLGCAASFALYRFAMYSVEYPYTFPWLAVLECCVGVFAVTWVTMRYAASRLRGGSIINAIRAEGSI
ncbi:hypothetical protein FACS189490_11200 [Clostridia bacterium]|nr:hypothetical protein FACS189490_11200 [Clostridia bacterium]